MTSYQQSHFVMKRSPSILIHRNIIYIIWFSRSSRMFLIDWNDAQRKIRWWTRISFRWWTRREGLEISSRRRWHNDRDWHAVNGLQNPKPNLQQTIEEVMQQLPTTCAPSGTKGNSGSNITSWTRLLNENGQVFRFHYDTFMTTNTTITNMVNGLPNYKRFKEQWKELVFPTTIVNTVLNVILDKSASLETLFERNELLQIYKT